MWTLAGEAAGVYEKFWPRLLKDLPDHITPKTNRLKLNYWTFDGPRVGNSCSVWSTNFPKNLDRLRVEGYFGNALQRRGVDVPGTWRAFEDDPGPQNQVVGQSQIHMLSLRRGRRPHSKPVTTALVRDGLGLAG